MKLLNELKHRLILIAAILLFIPFSCLIMLLGILPKALILAITGKLEYSWSKGEISTKDKTHD